MKKKSNQRSAFFNPRVLIGLVVFGAGVCLALVGFGAFSTAFGQPKGASRAAPKPVSGTRPVPGSGFTTASGHSLQRANTNVQFSPADRNGRFVYMIEFAEAGLLSRTGVAGGRFVPNSPQAQANRQQLMGQQAAHVQTISGAIGRSLDVTHHFLATHSGIAARFTPEEAATVRALPGIKKIERERVYHVTTFRSPAFIGADKIWDGSQVPGGTGTRGAGIIVANLDTGLDTGIGTTHPSFIDDASCGHGTTAPSKLLSALDCSATDVQGLCNGPDPGDNNGHGTHTASTSAGNFVDASANPPPAPPAPFTSISGVAPCASIRAYKVCATNQCDDADINAGMNSVLLHGDVDVMNFSISGGDNPWQDNDRRKLDLVEAGVLVSASAGNTSASIPDPVGQVNHLGPWVNTIAASTRDGEFTGNLSASGPGTPPPDTQNIHLEKGSDSPLGTNLTNFPIRHFVGQPDPGEGCTASTPAFPPGFFDGAAALVKRGGCTFTEKITNAFNAGAQIVFIRNNQPGTVLMSTPGQPDVPAYSMDQAPGDALVAFVDANPTTATVDFTLVPSTGDALAGFSLRGPVPAPFQGVTKPDITGPGVNIYAGFPLNQGGYGGLSGTSMSSPHSTGSSALVRSVHPTWTVQEVRSALMMTAFEGGTKEDEATPWDADDVGNGRMDLTKAARAGLVMDETFANFLAADPGTGGDEKTLNIASVRNVNCSPNCSWTRTVRNTRTVPTFWHASGVNITPGFTIAVTPATFSFTGNLSETQQITITATPTTDLTSAVAFGKVVFEASARAPTPTPSPRPTVTPKPHASPSVTPSPRPSQTPKPIPTPPPGPNNPGGNSNRGTSGNGGGGGNSNAPVEHISVAIQGTNGALPTPTPTPTPGGCPATITHSTSQTIAAGNSAACAENGTLYTNDNSYWRAFNMNTFTGGLAYNVTSVSFGIEQATANMGGGGTQPMTVNLYAQNGSAFPGGFPASLTLLGTAPVTVSDQNLTVLTVPITASVPAGTLELVMEVHVPDGTVPGHVFFIGSNASAESGPSYLSAAGCGIPTPVTTATIGFGGMHLVFNVNGSCPVP